MVTFNGSKLNFNYAVIDGICAPFVAGNLLVIPDGTKDNKIIDPVWLMKKMDKEPDKERDTDDKEPTRGSGGGGDATGAGLLGLLMLAGLAMRGQRRE